VFVSASHLNSGQIFVTMVANTLAYNVKELINDIKRIIVQAQAVNIIKISSLLTRE
jgi:hypothetical protein